MSDMTNLDGTKTSDELWKLANDPEASREVAMATIERTMMMYGWTREEAMALFWCASADSPL